MKITERKLRRIIRSVIRESSYKPSRRGPGRLRERDKKIYLDTGMAYEELYHEYFLPAKEARKKTGIMRNSEEREAYQSGNKETFYGIWTKPVYEDMSTNSSKGELADMDYYDLVDYCKTRYKYDEAIRKAYAGESIF